ncbi:hypothetical protein [Glycomyces terrestris]|uniref:Uncharacterized protein n=1 Tax=Glycomyces terrestris TaxID=2493553 RepID=A0A426UWG5_9ACTN|nr:hypothetical protein [Glycomyces terrestris]RRR98539.1 hypothetical protein EIW28_16825 [Glycomyces terrestris]
MESEYETDVANRAIKTLTETLDHDLLGDLLRTSGISVELVWEQFQWNAPGHGMAIPPAVEQVREREILFRNSLQAAARLPLGPAMLGMFVWGVAHRAWKLSYEFTRMIGGLEEFERQWEELRPLVPDADERAAGEAVVALMRMLVEEIRVEDALCCGDLSRHLEAVKLAQASAAELGNCVQGLPEDSLSLRDGLMRIWNATSAYYKAVEQVLLGVRARLGGPGIDLTDAFAALTAAEDAPLTYVQKSELRGHRSCLERIDEAADSEWLTLDHLKTVYLFPFGCNGVDAEDAVDSIRAQTSPPALGGIGAVAIRRVLELCDVWAGADFHKRRFEGASIQLPPVRLSHPDGVVVDELKAEVRLSVLGNHYVRLESHQYGLDPHSAMFTLFRAAPEHGTMLVSCGGADRHWAGLHDFATELQAAVASVLGEGVESRSGRYHVLATVYEASVRTGANPRGQERRSVKSGKEFRAAFGAQAVLHTVPNGIESIGDWARFTVPSDTVLATVRKAGNLVVGTANSTILVPFGMPTFGVGTYETVAEFVGTLDGLYSVWSDRLAQRHREVTELVSGIQTSADAAKLTKHAARLRRELVSLHDFASEYRAVQSLIHSPNFMASPADTEALTELLALSGVEQSEQDIADKLGQLLNDRLEVHIEAIATEFQEHVEMERERRARRSRSLIEALLAAMAATGFAGVVQVLQTASLPNEWAWALLGVIITAAITCSVAVYRWSNPSSEEQDPEGNERPR